MDSQLMGIEEIETRYAPDWVLIAEPEVDELQRLQTGKVVFHSPDRDAVYREAAKLPGDRFAIRFLGELPDNVVFLF